MRIDDIHQQLAKKYNLPIPVVSMICNHPFVFTSRKMAEANDLRDIRLPYLGIFKIRTGVRNKLDKYNELTGEVGSLDRYRIIEKYLRDESSTEDRTKNAEPQP